MFAEPCEENEYSYDWKEGQTPNPFKNDKIDLCKCHNFVPILVPVLSSKAHLTNSEEDSLKSTKELIPDEQETATSSRDRLQDLPERSQEFTETLVEPRSTSSGCDNKDPPGPSRPESLPSQVLSGKYILFTHFPKDQNGEICQRTKIT